MKIKRVSDATSRKFRLRVLHVGDNHGYLPKLEGRFDIVLHSGDFFPNSIAIMNKNINQEMAFQLDWLSQNLTKIKQWLQGAPFLFVPGNHDFLHPTLMENTLKAGGVNAINLMDKVVEYENVNFYGFPYVPPISDMWNYEKELPEMQEEIDKMVSVLNTNYVDVLVAHAPFYQMLDLTMGNQCIGNSLMNTAIDYKLNKDMIPQYYLHGHLHENYGVSIRNGMLVSNAATSQNIVEIK